MVRANHHGKEMMCLNGWCWILVEESFCAFGNYDDVEEDVLTKTEEIWCLYRFLVGSRSSKTIY